MRHSCLEVPRGCARMSTEQAHKPGPFCHAKIWLRKAAAGLDRYHFLKNAESNFWTWDSNVEYRAVVKWQIHLLFWYWTNCYLFTVPGIASAVVFSSVLRLSLKMAKMCRKHSQPNRKKVTFKDINMVKNQREPVFVENSNNPPFYYLNTTSVAELIMG